MFCSIRLISSVHSLSVVPDLNEGVAGSIIGDGQSQSVLSFKHLNFLFLALDVGKNKVLKSNLTSQKFIHVHFVSVQCTKHDLWTDITSK